MDNGTYTIHAGDDVYGSDGEKVGSVVAVEQHFVVVEKGWFFPTDFYIPVGAIASFDDGRITLNVTKENALDQGWDTAPVVVSDTATTSSASDAAAWGRSDTATTVTETSAPARDRGALDARTTMTGNTLRLPVHQEELVATRTARNIAGLRIEKVVVVEDRHLDLSTGEVRLKVVRRAVKGAVDSANDDMLEEVLVDIPLELDAFVAANEGRVGEELVITREVTQRIERVAGTVRREEVHVTEATAGTLLDEMNRPR